MSNSSSFFEKWKRRLAVEHNLTTFRQFLVELIDQIQDLGSVDAGEISTIVETIKRLSDRVASLEKELATLKKKVAKIEKAIQNILKLMSGGE